MNHNLTCLLAAIFLCTSSIALATTLPPAKSAPITLNQSQTERYLALLPQLRCMQCQNESLASSQAPWAQGARARIRRMIVNGESDRQIKDYLVARYGQYVLYRPRFEPTTWLLWIGPFMLLVLGVGTLFAIVIHRQRRNSGTAGLGGGNPSDEVLTRVRRWLEGDGR